MSNAEYQKGYAAGRRRAKSQIEILERKLHEATRGDLTRKDRIYLECLNTVMQHAGPGWKINSKPVNSARQYCRLADSFARESIKILGD